MVVFLFGDEKELVVVEAFSGIGAQVQALKNIGIKHKIKAIVEIDKYAIQSYEAIHGATPNLGDITKVEKLPDCDLFTYSFPCTDVSVAGKQQGVIQGETRSGLVYEVLRLLQHENRPKYLLMENVKNLVGKKFKKDFDIICRELEKLGYTNYWRVLNARGFGVPQNRERVFMVSILGEHQPFRFPVEKDLNVKLRDVLETVVDEKYYLSDDMVERFKKSNYKSESKSIKVLGTTKSDTAEGTNCRGWVYDIDKSIGTLAATDYKQPKQILVDDVMIGAIRGRNPDNPTSRESGLPAEQMLELNYKGVSNTLTTVQKDNVVVINPQIKIAGHLDIAGRHESCLRVYDDNGIAPTMVTGSGGGHIPKVIDEKEKFRIRKLTAKETWRLMGFYDEAFDKAEKVVSNTQLYKQAGNSIVVPVLEEIFKNMFLR